MNILIVSMNRNRTPVPVVPLGACMTAEAAERAGHRVRFLDMMFCRDLRAALVRELRQARPDAVGLSLRNIDNNDLRRSVAYFPEAASLVELVHRHSSAPVVLGGAAVGLMPRQLLRATGADIAVTGDGETVFPLLLNALSGGGSLREIPGVVSRDGDALIARPFVPPGDAGWHIPDFSRWIDVRRYLTMQATAPLQSKRGCPFRCVYCTYTLREGSSYRLVAPEQAARELERLRGQGFRDVEFVDNVFNAPYEHALALCRAIEPGRHGVRLHTLELNPRFIDDRLLSAMERAGFASIGITPESAADRVLEGLNKDYHARDVRAAAGVIGRHRLPCLWMFMLGGPGETRETVLETMEFARECITPRDVAFFNIGVRIYPGTGLEEIARRDGVLSLPPERMLDPVYYVSPRVDARWITEKVGEYMRTSKNFINSRYLDFPFLGHIYRAGQFLGMKSPLWQYVPAVRRMLGWTGIPA
jgi:radical SAM superfamily enzyme YgiQ (UPF0313 family)